MSEAGAITCFPPRLAMKVLCPAYISESLALTGTNMPLAFMDRHELVYRVDWHIFRVSPIATLEHTLDVQAQDLLNLLWKTD